jgi:hypothetical protein
MLTISNYHIIDFLNYVIFTSNHSILLELLRCRYNARRDDVIMSKLDRFSTL